MKQVTDFKQGLENRIHKSGTINSDSGNESIYYRQDLPLNYSQIDSFTHVIIIHGATEYHGRHLLLPEYIKSNFSKPVVFSWIDLKGHGLSGGRRAYINNFGEYCDDVAKFLNFSSQEFGKNKIVKTILLSHSMGGTICIKLALEYKQKLKINIDGLVLSSPCIKVVNRSKALKKVISFASKYTPYLKIPTTTNGFNLTNDPEMATDYNTDNLILKHITPKLIDEIIKTTRSLRTFSYYIDCPCLFLFGENDNVVENNAGILFAKGISPKLTQKKIYHNMGHELLTHTNRELVYKDICEWVNAIIQL